MEYSETKTQEKTISAKMRIINSYYGLLGLHPSASVIEIRRSYRELSKQYHPDTTELPSEEAKEKFQRINEAYATLSNPEKRAKYDLKIGYSRLNVIESNMIQQKAETKYETKSAYLDATDRPLSGGEVFALFLIGVSFLGSIMLVFIVALIRGESL